MPKIRDDRLPKYVYPDGPTRYKISAPTPKLDPRTGKPTRTTIRRDADGNVLDSVEAAVLELARRSVAVADGTAAYDGGWTFERWANDWYRRRVEGNEIKPNTARSQRRHLDTANELIGKKRLRDVTPADLKRVLDSVPVKREATRQLTYTTLRTLFEAAVFEGLLMVSPMRRVKRPKANQKRVQIWTMAETRQFLAHTRSDRLGPLFRLAFNTGLRRGELIGLKWTDYADGALTVRQQLVQLCGDDVPACPICGERHWGAVEQSVKTVAGEQRVVELTRHMIDLIEFQRIAQFLERTNAADAWVEHGYIFTNELGGPMKPAHLTRRFRELAREIGLTGWMHIARHTHASALIAADTPLHLVSKRLGHANIGTTHHTYSHLVKGVSAAAAERAAALFADDDPVSVGDLSAGGDADADTP